MKKAFEKTGYGLNIYYAPGAAIMPKGVAAAAFAGKELIDARDQVHECKLTWIWHSALCYQFCL